MLEGERLAEWGAAERLVVVQRRHATALARECCLAVADNDGSVALEALEGVDGDGVFLVESVLEFVADGAENAGHRGAFKCIIREELGSALDGGII